MFRKNKMAALFLSGALMFLAVAPVAQAALPTSVAVVAVGDGDPSVPPVYDEPKDLPEAADDVLLAVKLGKTGQWMAMALVITQLLIFALKKVPKTSAQMKKWGTVIVLVLSAVAAVLVSMVGGASWIEAALVFLGTAAPKILNDLLHELGVIPHKLDSSGQPQE